MFTSAFCFTRENQLSFACSSSLLWDYYNSPLLSVFLTMLLIAPIALALLLQARLPSGICKLARSAKKAKKGRRARMRNWTRWLTACTDRILDVEAAKIETEAIREESIDIIKRVSSVHRFSTNVLEPSRWTDAPDVFSSDAGATELQLLETTAEPPQHVPTQTNSFDRVNAISKRHGLCSEILALTSE